LRAIECKRKLTVAQSEDGWPQLLKLLYSVLLANVFIKVVRKCSISAKLFKFELQR